jgi:hypothetical protein
MLRNIVSFYCEKLFARRPNHNLEDDPLSAVRECLFNIQADPVSAVYRGTKNIWKIKEINGSYVSQRAPSDNGP